MASLRSLNLRHLYAVLFQLGFILALYLFSWIMTRVFRFSAIMQESQQAMTEALTSGTTDSLSSLLFQMTFLVIAYALLMLALFALFEHFILSYLMKRRMSLMGWLKASLILLMNLLCLLLSFFVLRAIIQQAALPYLVLAAILLFAYTTIISLIHASYSATVISAVFGGFAMAFKRFRAFLSFAGVIGVMFIFLTILFLLYLLGFDWHPIISFVGLLIIMVWARQYLVLSCTRNAIISTK
ncbi:hypothetical protein JXB02_04355 [Candidatus Woesearchaeota archaeon]|nr:hypothetical protein [Candidatus Woesearchaeota archaeon]